MLIDSSVSSQSLESLTERCESALLLLEEAQQSMESEPLPDGIQVGHVLFSSVTKVQRSMVEPTVVDAASDVQAVASSIDKHRQLMVSVLADQRITELQQRGGAWLAGLTNNSAGLAQKSPDCRYLNTTVYLTRYPSRRPSVSILLQLQWL